MSARSLFNARKDRKRLARRLLTLAPALTCLGASAGANAQELSAAQQLTDPTDTVVILGTNRKDQTALGSTSPIDVITAQQLTESGASTLSEALVRISPSANFPQNSVGPMASNGKSIALRGLAPDQSLVLVNGKRLVAQATLTSGNPPMFGYMGHPQDINIIPISAVERVEILRDGASAQYGSDAIAGVVNIVLKGKARGGSLSAQIGQFSAEDKPHGAPGTPPHNVQIWRGLPLGDGGFVTLSAEYEKSTHPEDGVPSPNPVYAPDGPAAQGDRPDYDPLRHLMGYAGPSTSYKALANAELPFGESWTAYGTLSGAYIDRVGASLTVPMYDAKAIIGLFPEGRDDFPEVKTEALTSALGVRLETHRLGSFDLGATFGRNKNRNYAPQGYNQSMGLDSPVGLYTGSTRTQVFGVNLDWLRPFEVGLTVPLTVSGGLAYRQDKYVAEEGEFASWYIVPGATIGPGHYRWNAATQTFIPLNPTTAAQSGGGISPSEAGTWTRDVVGVFADVEGQLTSKLSFGIAARFEDYSDAGSAASGKLSARYDFTPTFAIRSTISNGFRAPSLIQSNYTSRQATAAVGTLLIPAWSLPVTDPLARLLGAEDLKPETSVEFSAGFVWRPSPRTSLSVDAYQIRVDDKIAYSENLQDTGNGLFNAILVQNGYQTGSVVRFFTNGIDSRTNGVDLIGRTSFTQEGVGLWDLSVGFSAIDVEVTRVAPTPAAIASTGVRLIGIQIPLMVTDGTPNTKLSLGQRLTTGNWSIGLQEKRYGTYKETLSSTAPTIQTFSPQWIVDLDIGYELSAGARITLGAKNLFSSYPDEEWPSNRRVGQTRYPHLAPEGFDGRFVYAQFALDF
jgi:iron complex outermembrane receptor protein